jgi:AAA domain, putative AbiEii toxin, Type IV TA system
VHGGEDGGPVWLTIKDPQGASHNARALSEGTLRFLALAVLWLDPEATGVFCIEEPENGIHPSKLPALLRLLRDISEKPGCQVIVNTHSPALVAQTPAEDIIVAFPVQRAEPDGTFYTIPRFGGLKGTWRQEKGMPVATISQVMDYLDPIPQRYADEPLRLLDRDDARRLVEQRRKFTWEETED